jgi:hypothetical protein
MKLLFAPLSAVVLVLLAPLAARADDAAAVHIATPGADLQIFNRTNDVTMLPVRVGRGATALERSYVFSPLCDHTPCDVRLEPGRHVLALSEPGGALLQGEAVHVDGTATITATHIDRTGLRIVGGALLVGAGGAGLGLMYASNRTKTVCSPGTAATPAGPPTPIAGSTGSGGTIVGYVPSDGTPATPGSCGNVETINPGLMAAGIGVLAAGLIAGLVMMLQPDAASFTVTPLTFSSLGPHRENALEVVPNGLALSIRF